MNDTWDLSILYKGFDDPATWRLWTRPSGV